MNLLKKICLNILLIITLNLCTSLSVYSQFYIEKNYQSHKVLGNKLIITTDGGLIEIEAWNDDIVRVSYDKDYKGNLSLTPSVYEHCRCKSVDISEETATMFYSTKNIKIKINKKPLIMEYYQGNRLMLKDTLGGFFYYPGYEYHGIKFGIQPKEIIYGFGSQARNINRREFSMQLLQKNRFGYEWPYEANLNFAIPFFMSSLNYGIYFDDLSHSVICIDDKEKNVLRFNTLRTKFSFFLIAGNSYTDILNKYTDLTGKQGLPPRWAMGYLQSRAYYHSEDEVRDVVSRMRENDFPMDALVFDATWYGGLDEMGNLFWSTERFPNYKSMIKDFAQIGINVIPITQLYISSLSKHYNYIKQSKIICTDKFRKPVYCRLQKRDDFLVYDMTNP